MFDILNTCRMTLIHHCLKQQIWNKIKPRFMMRCSQLGTESLADSDLTNILVDPWRLWLYSQFSVQCVLHTCTATCFWLTHKTLQLVVPQWRCPQTISHQSKERLLHLTNTNIFPSKHTKMVTNNSTEHLKNSPSNQRSHTCSVVSKMTSLELVGMAS